MDEVDRSYELAAMTLLEIESFMALQGLKAQTAKYFRSCVANDSDIHLVWGFEEWFFSSVDPHGCREPTIAVSLPITPLVLFVRYHAIAGWKMMVDRWDIADDVDVDVSAILHGLVALGITVPSIPLGEISSAETNIDEPTAYKVMGYMAEGFKKQAGLT